MHINIRVVVDVREEFDPRDYTDDTERLLVELNGKASSQSQDHTEKPRANDTGK